MPQAMQHIFSPHLPGCCALPLPLQCVLTPADPYMPKTNEEIAAETDRQVGLRCSLMPGWL